MDDTTSAALHDEAAFPFGVTRAQAERAEAALLRPTPGRRARALLIAAAVAAVAVGVVAVTRARRRA